MDGLVVTDDPLLAFVTGRLVTPALTEASYRQIDRGHLTAEDLIVSVLRYRVRAVLFATGRLEQLPSFERWVATVATERRDFGPLRAYRLDLPLSAPHPVASHLGNGVELRGYALSGEELRPGDVLTVTLFWERDGPVTEDYHVFVHLVGKEDRIWGQHDGLPLLGAYPTSRWAAGLLLPDSHTLVVSPEIPPGRYRLLVGMYRWPSLERLPAYRPGGERWLDDRILLTKVPILGQRIVYTLTVESSDPFGATGAVISDTLPAGLTFAGPVALEGGGGTMADDASDLPTLVSGLTITAGERITVTFPVTVNTDLTNDTVLTNAVPVTSTEVSTPQIALQSIQVTETVGVIFINEILAANGVTNRDPDHYAFSDWIEIYNSGSRPIDLGGFYLTDDLDDATKWQIPAETIIEPEGFKLFWADGVDGTDDAYHTNFKLRQGGEEVGLFGPEGVLIDSVIYDPQIPDVSFGRQPDASSHWFFFGEPTPRLINDTEGCPEQIIAPPPQFSLPGGFYSGNQVIELSIASSSAVIRYTLDGSIPTNASAIYTSSVDVNSTTVIRARAFETGYLPSPVIAHTYFVDEACTLPVVSISTDPDNLWDGMTGIYARHWENLENPISLEFYEADGHLGFSLNAGARIHGGHSRTLPQKPLAIFARNKYGTDVINYRIFNDKPVDRFKTFVLRNSGNDWRATMFRDAMMQALVKDQMDVDFLAYRPAIVFLNGEYWGIYNIREKINEHYPESNYGVDPGNVDLLHSHVYHPGHHIALAGDVEHYNNLLHFIESNDMAVPESYDYVKTQMDVNEYLNYQISEIYFANTDWLQSNIRYWRPKTEDGKWRWIIYGTDVGFNLDVSIYGWGNRDFTYNMIEYAANSDKWESLLLGKLLENPEFRNEFIQRFASHLNITFHPDRVIQIIDRLKANIEPEMPGHIAMWKKHCGGHDYSECGIQSLVAWENDVDVMRDFANQRPAYVRQHIIDRFGLSGTVTLNSSGSSRGRVLINNVVVPDSNFTGIYFKDVPLQLEAVPNPGYQFADWQGISDADSDSVLVTLTEDSTITATFERAGYLYLAESLDLAVCTSSLWTSDMEMQNRARWSLTDMWVITRVASLVINEIHYNPSSSHAQGDDDYEFIELYNAGRSTVDLSG